MFHPGTLNATMFVSCAQRIVPSYFIVAIVACVASAQRHAHGRIRHTVCSMPHASSQPAAHRRAPSLPCRRPCALQQHCGCPCRPTLSEYSTAESVGSALPHAEPAREVTSSHRKTAQKRRRCPFRCTARAVRRRSMPAVYLLLYRAVPRALPPVMASASGRRFARS
jgi:hypothetical protein